MRQDSWIRALSLERGVCFDCEDKEKDLLKPGWAGSEWDEALGGDCGHVHPSHG